MQTAQRNPTFLVLKWSFQPQNVGEIVFSSWDLFASVLTNKILLFWPLIEGTHIEAVFPALVFLISNLGSAASSTLLSRRTLQISMKQIIYVYIWEFNFKFPSFQAKLMFWWTFLLFGRWNIQCNLRGRNTALSGGGVTIRKGISSLLLKEFVFRTEFHLALFQKWSKRRQWRTDLPLSGYITDWHT